MKYQGCWYRKFILLFATMIAGCSRTIPYVSSALPPPEQTIIPTPTFTTTSLSLKGKIAFVHINGDSGIYVMNADGNELRNLTPTLPYSRNPAWSPDGKYIAFESPVNGTTQIYSIRVDGSELRQLTFSNSHSYNPVWSFDGKRIIFLSQRDDIVNDQGIPVQQGYVMNSDGSEERRFTNDQEFVNAISWYPKDGLVSVSVANTRDTLRTYITDIDGKIQNQFPEFVIDGIPAWSPHGDEIVFSAVRQGCSGIIVAKADGSDQTCLKINNLHYPTHVGGVGWSPDGQNIIFSSNLDGDSDLYLVKVDGTNLAQLTNLPGDEGTPVWIAGP